VAHGQQASDLRRVVLPHPLNNRPDEEIRAVVGERLAEIVGALTGSTTDEVSR
jgi:hypothetical protein